MERSYHFSFRVDISTQFVSILVPEIRPTAPGAQNLHSYFAGNSPQNHVPGYPWNAARG